MKQSSLKWSYKPVSLDFSDIRDGAIVCLIANLMEQLAIDRAADLYHQARKIHHTCPAFQTEVNERWTLSANSHRLYAFRMNTVICMNGCPSGQRMTFRINTNDSCDIVISCSVSVVRWEEKPRNEPSIRLMNSVLFFKESCYIYLFWIQRSRCRLEETTKKELTDTHWYLDVWNNTWLVAFKVFRHLAVGSDGRQGCMKRKQVV